MSTKEVQNSTQDIKKHQQEIAEDINSESDIFDFYSPTRTFSKENVSGLFLDRYSKPITSSFMLIDKEPEALDEYFTKGKHCYDSLIGTIIEHNDDLSAEDMSDEIIVSTYTEMGGYAHWVANVLQNEKRMTFINKEDGSKFDAVAYVEGHINLGLKYSLLEGNPDLMQANAFGNNVYAFAALQHLDDIIFDEVSEMNGGSSLGSTSSFHDCYFKAVAHEQIIEQTSTSLRKNSTAAASKAKSLRAVQRNAYIKELFASSELSRTDFSYSNGVQEKINQFSIKVGLSPLKPSGAQAKIYRLLKPE